jgi:hypothetical protein
MEFRPLSEIDLKKEGWQRGEGDQVLVNPQFGEIVRIGVQGPNYAYDAFLHNEPIGAVTLPIRSDGCVGFITSFRPTFKAGTHRFPIRKEDFGNLGCESLELPRGFPIKGEPADQTAKREGAEELGSPIISVKKLGVVTPNTTFHPHQIPVYLAEIDEKFEGDIPGDVNEKILGKIFLEPKAVLAKIVAGEIYCGFTLSALMMWLSGIMSDKDLFD